MLKIVLGGSDAGHKLDAPILGIAAELVLAGVADSAGRQASRPTAVGTAEGEVVVVISHAHLMTNVTPYQLGVTPGAGRRLLL